MDDTRSINELAKEIVALATADVTPVSYDNWDLDLALRKVERRVIVEENNPALFAEICGEMSGDLVGVYPAAQALLTLGVINGLRRQPDYSPSQVSGLLDSVATLLTCIDDSDPRKLRLRILRPYHGAIFYEGQGNYALAADMLAESAKVATEAGDTNNAKIANFRAQQTRIYAALKAGIDTKELLQNFGYTTLRELNVPGIWEEFNGPAAVTIAHFLSEQVMDASTLEHVDVMMATLLDDSVEVVIGQASGWYVTQAINLLWQDLPKHAWLTAASALSKEFDPLPQYASLAYLILGVIARDSGSLSKARTYFSMATSVPHTPDYIKAVGCAWHQKLST